MANTGPNLIAAIVENVKLMSVDNCPGVPVQMGKAVYGACQNDSGSGTLIKSGLNMQKQINNAIGFSGSNSDTAVWHFSLAPVHHFVVVPWYKHESPHGQVYTVFMAYEGKYSLGQYVGGTGGIAPAPGGKGYKAVWTVSQLSAMFSALLAGGTAWQDYFGQVGAAQATKITYWKYKTTTLKYAISIVKKY